MIKCLEFVSEKDLFQGITSFWIIFLISIFRKLHSPIGKASYFWSEFKYWSGKSHDWKAQNCLCVSTDITVTRYPSKYCFRYEFSSKIKRMYEDIKNSACQQEEFNKKYQDQTFHLDVKVLQDGCWPFSKVQQNFNLPNTLEASLQNYTSFYE